MKLFNVRELTAKPIKFTVELCAREKDAGKVFKDFNGTIAKNTFFSGSAELTPSDLQNPELYSWFQALSDRTYQFTDLPYPINTELFISEKVKEYEAHVSNVMLKVQELESRLPAITNQYNELASQYLTCTDLIALRKVKSALADFEKQQAQHIALGQFNNITSTTPLKEFSLKCNYRSETNLNLELCFYGGHKEQPLISNKLKNAAVKHAIALRHAELEIESAAKAQARQAKQEDVNNWIHNHGSETLTKGHDKGFDMTRLYREERAKQFVDVYFPNCDYVIDSDNSISAGEKASPSLPFLNALDTKFENENTELTIVWAMEREYLEVRNPFNGLDFLYIDVSTVN